MPLFQCGAVQSALRSVLLRANILHCLHYSFTVRHIYSTVKCTSELSSLWGLSRSHHPVVCLLGFWTVKTPKSKRNLAQHNNEKELLNEIDSGVLKSQVWFHIALTSASAPAISSRHVRDEKLINFYCDICRRGKCENKQKKSSAAPPLRPFVSVRTPLIFLLNL